MLQLALEENQARCEFFKHFQYSNKDKLGTVSQKVFLDQCKNFLNVEENFRIFSV